MFKKNKEISRAYKNCLYCVHYILGTDKCIKNVKGQGIAEQHVCDLYKPEALVKRRMRTKNFNYRRA